jgi:hypothetical protein
MKRKALIITNPGERGEENYCEGVNKDIELYRSFLQSPEGGLWQDSEIRTLERPNLSTVEAEVGRLQLADYSFVAYSGHAYHSGRSTILALKRGVELDSAKLKVGASKHTLVLDCCRVVERPTLLLEKMLKALQARPILHSNDCRLYYDNRIEECPNGLVVLYGCSIDQTAGDDASTGGYYSASLIESAEEWVASESHLDTQRQFSIRSVVQAHADAVSKVATLSGNRQTPAIEKPRSEPYYPFSIVT